MYKKIIITIIIIITILIMTKKENTTLVSVEINDDHNTYRTIYLLFENNKLTTNNFAEYFKNDKIKILSIIPYINPIIKNRIPETLIYNFNNNSINYNIDKFVRYYSHKTNIYKVLNNQDYIINGITINKVIVYSSIEEINKINQHFKYSLNNEGPYQAIK